MYRFSAIIAPVGPRASKQTGIGKHAAHIPVPISHPMFGAAYMTAVARPGDDEQATAQTIAQMRRLALEDSQAPEIRAAAREAAASSQLETARNVFEWIRRRLQFVSDATLAGPVSATAAEDEVLIRPRDLVRMPRPAGDCDDYSMLAAAMLTAAGIPVTYRTVAADPATDRYSHVYVVAHTDRGAVALDCSHGPYLGWEVRRAGKARDWPLMPMQAPSQLHGVSAIDWNALLQIGAQTGAKIVTERYGQPQVAAGTYIQSGPQGQTIFRQPEGASGFAFPTTQISGASGSLLLWGGIALVLVLVLQRGRH